MSPNAVEAADALVAAVFNTAARLPLNPFRQRMQFFGFEEFDWLLSGLAWPALKKLATSSSDHEIIIAIAATNSAPSPYALHSRAVIPACATAQDYWDVITASLTTSAADALFATADVVALCANSTKWGVWAERETGLCVAGSLAEPLGSEWKSASWARDLVAPVTAPGFGDRLFKSTLSTWPRGQS